MASALSDALARKANLEANKLSPGGGMGRMGRMGKMSDMMESDESETTDPVEDAMSILFPDLDPAEAASAFRRASSACMSEESEPAEAEE